MTTAQFPEDPIRSRRAPTVARCLDCGTPLGPPAGYRQQSRACPQCGTHFRLPAGVTWETFNAECGEKS
ncbi:MAG: hypothetical protein JF597_00660 [Streptomyces sp.]|uniref:hypothetical protein n=1 Tax=Streptomyces sp. TaxID=1931 RepID=UPI0025D9798E|nr:hypothetical protein [Streptomyces sp.]MBW8792149.1 hypothetical protein [Streptomyces sp.]